MGTVPQKMASGDGIIRERRAQGYKARKGLVVRAMGEQSSDMEL